jgi:hypothetical protein
MPRVSVYTCKVSRAAKIYGVSNMRFLNVKWRGLDFTVLLSTALKFRGLPVQNNCLAISSQMYRGLPTLALRPNANPAGGSGLWHSALKFGPLTIAIRSTAKFFVAIRLVLTAICYSSIMDLSVEFSKRVKSSPRHFTSRDPLFERSYIFEARLYVNALSCTRYRDTIPLKYWIGIFYLYLLESFHPNHWYFQLSGRTVSPMGLSFTVSFPFSTWSV